MKSYFDEKEIKQFEERINLCKRNFLKSCKIYFLFVLSSRGCNKIITNLIIIYGAISRLLLGAFVVHQQSIKY